MLGVLNEKIPNDFRNYFEPFFGGGALYFSLNLVGKKAFINDLNTALINTIQQIKFAPFEVVKLLDLYNVADVTREIYLKKRSLFNKKMSMEEYDLELAALMIFLNRYCFNGLYRTNKEGMFNVSWGKRLKQNLYEEKNIENVSEKLRGTVILNGDFQECTKYAGKKDLVFLDPPYDNSWKDYTKEVFSKNDQIRVAEEFKRLSDIGCYVIATNHNTELVRELYKGFNIEVVKVKRMINADAKNRTGEEVVITNF